MSRTGEESCPHRADIALRGEMEAVEDARGDEGCRWCQYSKLCTGEGVAVSVIGLSSR